jgi:hypothetical protein
MQQFDNRKRIFIKFNTAEFHGKKLSGFSFGSKSENMMGHPTRVFSQRILQNSDKT